MASLKDLLVMGPARFLGNTYHNTITTNTLTSDVLVRNKAHILAPGGGTFTTRTSQYTGFLKITLPCSWTNAMLRFYVDIYNHGTTATSTTYVVSGYPKYDAEGVNNGWLSTSAISLGSIDTKLANLPVTFGHDGNYCAIYIGTTTTNWTYPQVIIRDLTTGFIASNEIFKNGWNISFTTTPLLVANSRIEKPHVAEEANHAKLASEASELFTFSLQSAGTTHPETNPEPHIWNPLTWTIKKTWSGGGGIYALTDREGYFFGIFQVKVRISEYTEKLSPFINTKKVDWLSTSHETGVPTLTLTEEIVERGNETTAPEVIFRLYVTAPGGSRSYNLITITEIKGTVPTRNANKVSSIIPEATTEVPHIVSSSTAIAFMANKWTTKRKFTISSQAGTTGIDVNGTANVELKIPEEMSNFKKITFADAGINSSIVFSREDWNYISTTSNAGSIALSPGGVGSNYTTLVASNSAVFPGNRNNVALGTSIRPWNSIYGNTVYADRINVKYSLFVSNLEEESRIGVRFNSDSSALYLYGRHNVSERGLYDSKAGSIILINENNFIRFNGTANKADILATSRKFTISSTAGKTGTDFNGETDVSLIIPSSVSGFETLAGGTGVFNIVGSNTTYISSGEKTSLIFCRGGADTAHEVGRFDTSNNFIIKNTVQGKLLQIKRDDSWPYLSLVFGSYSKGTCYLTGNSTSSTARIGFYVYSKNSTTKIPTDKYIDFKLPEVAPDLTSNQSHTILVADASGNISLDKSLYLNIPSGVTRGIGVRYKNNDATSSSLFYMFANTTSGDRGIYDAATQKRIIDIGSNAVINFNGTNFNASNNMYVNGKKVYHEGTIVYSDDPPDSPAPGMIWLKPLAQTSE